jgi:hypothetical protein
MNTRRIELCDQKQSQFKHAKSTALLNAVHTINDANALFHSHKQIYTTNSAYYRNVVHVWSLTNSSGYKAEIASKLLA